MPGVKPKYTEKQTAIWRGEMLLLLSQSPEAMSIQQMQAKSMFLSGVTNQKLARILGECIDYGLVVKGKSKSGLMMYKSRAVHEAQGYEVKEVL